MPTKEELQADLDAALRENERLKADIAGKPTQIVAGAPKEYVYRAYPKTLYHALKKPRVVHDPEEQAALGAGWHETPVDATGAPLETHPSKPVEADDE